MSLSRKSLIRSAGLGLALVFLYFFITGISYLSTPKNAVVYQELPMHLEPIGEITSDVTLHQTFDVCQNIAGIRIRFATYSGRENAGLLHVVISGDDSGTVYVDRSIDVSEMIDNLDVYFQTVSPIFPENDSTCSIYITADSETESAVTIWASAPDSVPGGVLLVNGEKVSSNLCIAFSFLSNVTYWTWKRILPLLFIFIISLISYTFPWENRRPNICRVLSSQISNIKAYWQYDIFRFWAGIVISGATALTLLACIYKIPSQQPPYNVYQIAFGVAVCFCVLLFILWRKALLGSPHNIFLLVSISAGLILTAFSPIKTGVVTDDEAHFERAVYVSYLGKPEYSKTMQILAACVEPNEFGIESIQEDINQMDSLHLTGEKNEITRRPVSTIFGCLPYIPMGIGIWLGRILDLGFHNIFILGRITNLMFYITVVYLAIRICPVGKRLMMTIALFPTNLMLAANYSYDPWITSLTMLWMAMLFDEVAHPDQKLSFSRVLFMLVLFILALYPKQVYCVLGLMFLLLPREKFSNTIIRKQFYGAVFLCVVLLAFSLLQPFLSGTGYTGDSRGGSDVNSMEQLKFILTHPLQYAKVLLCFLLRYLSPETSDHYTTFLIYLGESSFYALALIQLTFVTLTDHEGLYGKTVYSLPVRMITYVTLFATVCLVCTSLYIVFTPVGYDSINGVQARYLMPLLFPALMLTGSDKIKCSICPLKYDLAVGAVCALVAFGSIWECCISKYTYLW